jgi:chemotaxis protein methyltransferase CheR
LDVQVTSVNEPLVDDLEIKLLLDAIYLRFHYDFRNYAMASLRRRLAKALLRFQCDSVSHLQARLLHEPAIFTQLLQLLTVQVSDLFRDPSFFRTLRERIVPELRTYPSPKVWIAGCATGEEVFSLAILLREEALLERTLIYATDINPEALRKAAAGVYPLDRLAAFTDNHRSAGGKGSLSAYYTAAYGSAVLDGSLLKRVVFSDHSLATDNVFAEVQLVLCRNVLIYFDRGLQERALGLFKDAICRRGFLGLGGKETLSFSKHAAAFQRLDPNEQWYQRW